MNAYTGADSRVEYAKKWISTGNAGGGIQVLSAPGPRFEPRVGFSTRSIGNETALHLLLSLPQELAVYCGEWGREARSSKRAGKS